VKNTYLAWNCGGIGCCLPYKNLGYFQENRSVTVLSFSAMEIGLLFYLLNTSCGLKKKIWGRRSWSLLR